MKREERNREGQPAMVQKYKKQEQNSVESIRRQTRHQPGPKLNHAPMCDQKVKSFVRGSHLVGPTGLAHRTSNRDGVGITRTDGEVATDQDRGLRGRALGAAGDGTVAGASVGAGFALGGVVGGVDLAVVGAVGSVDLALLELITGRRGDSKTGNTFLSGHGRDVSLVLGTVGLIGVRRSSGSGGRAVVARGVLLALLDVVESKALLGGIGL
ncbi:hypothetical protein HDK64DRAFT_259861 [Phyllosticta capitalensis]